MNKIIKVSCIGLGHRGFGYLEEMEKYPEVFKIVAVCDINSTRLNQAKERFHLSNDVCFTNEDEFFKEKLSDLMIVSTQDQDHVNHAIKALKNDNDVLLEKPISNNEKDCRRLLKAQEATGKNVFVCHVLRYSPSFIKCKELLENGAIGKLMMIDALEGVGYYHQAHSFVRGNWRNSNETSPMIIAKCCHDLDLLVWYASSLCNNISSIGKLSYFKKENQPDGASDRCLDCKYKESCCYSAYNIYINEQRGQRNFITDERPITDEAIIKALKEGPYGRCVYKCDNNVVDHEVTMMNFNNGVTACLKFTAFTKFIARHIKFFGTTGEMVLDEENNTITVKHFDIKENEVYKTDSLSLRGYNHGGGDVGIIVALKDFYLGKNVKMATLKEAMESHFMGFAAEKSRLNKGKVVNIKH